MLDLHDIHTYYGDSYVLQGVSLHVGPRQVVGLLGRNGMGKTTLIRSIIGFTPPRQGQVRFKDQDITAWHRPGKPPGGGAGEHAAVDGRACPGAVPTPSGAPCESGWYAVGWRAADAGDWACAHDQS